MRMPALRIVIAMSVVLGCLTFGPFVAETAAASSISVEPSVLDFGTMQVGTAKGKPFTITNTGDVPITITNARTNRTTSTGGPITRADVSIFITDTNTNASCYYFRAGGPPPLSPGAKCVLYLQISAFYEPGSVTGAIRIESKVTDGGQALAPQDISYKASLSVPAGAPSLSLNTTSLYFGLAESGKPSTPLSVKLTNLGDTPLTFQAVTIEDSSGRADAKDFAQTSDCGTGLAANASCTIRVTFTPSDTVERFAILKVSDSAAGSPRYIYLQGTGTTPGACFAVTKHCMDARFFAYWQEHGGLAINGYPLSEPFYQTLEDGKFYLVQYFERVRMEYHPEATDAQFKVQLGQFGRKIHPAEPMVPETAGMTYFKETGHNVPSDLLAYWQANGGLAQFGFPLTEVFREKLEDGQEYEVQYFERARFERHPEAGPGIILLGQFGRAVCGSPCR